METNQIITQLQSIYLELQQQANKNASFAIKSYLSRALVRNLISDLSQLSAQEIQEDCESKAMIKTS